MTDAAMWQAGLFAEAPRQLLDDSEGGIRYVPGVLGRAEAMALHDFLRVALKWRLESRPMYEREVDVPRRTASSALSALDPIAFAPLLDAVGTVSACVPAPWTHAGFNHYRDGSDSVAMHHDRLRHLMPGQPIAVLSLGDVREMRFSGNAFGTRGQRIALEPGSVLVMSHASQSTTLHGIPKTTHRVGSRISVALRVRRVETD